LLWLAPAEAEVYLDTNLDWPLSSDAGRICFDNVPIERIGLEVVRENVVYVLQPSCSF